MHDTKFLSLTVRLHEPYWILHAGNCEHFFTITALRFVFVISFRLIDAKRRWQTSSSIRPEVGLSTHNANHSPFERLLPCLLQGPGGVLDHRRCQAWRKSFLDMHTVLEVDGRV